MKKFQLCYSKCFELALKSASQVRIESSKLLKKKACFVLEGLLKLWAKPNELSKETVNVEEKSKKFR